MEVGELLGGGGAPLRWRGWVRTGGEGGKMLDAMEEVVMTCSWFSRVVVTREEQLLLPVTAPTLPTLTRALFILC